MRDSKGVPRTDATLPSDAPPPRRTRHNFLTCASPEIFGRHSNFDPGQVHQPNQCKGASARALRRSVPEGIQDGHVEMREIAFVPSGHGEAVNASRGGYHGILSQGTGTAVH